MKYTCVKESFRKKKSTFSPAHIVPARGRNRRGRPRSAPPLAPSGAPRGSSAAIFGEAPPRSVGNYFVTMKIAVDGISPSGEKKSCLRCIAQSRTGTKEEKKKKKPPHERRSPKKKKGGGAFSKARPRSRESPRASPLAGVARLARRPGTLALPLHRRSAPSPEGRSHARLSRRWFFLREGASKSAPLLLVRLEKIRVFKAGNPIERTRKVGRSVGPRASPVPLSPPLNIISMVRNCLRAEKERKKRERKAKDPSTREEKKNDKKKQPVVGVRS